MSRALCVNSFLDHFPDQSGHRSCSRLKPNRFGESAVASSGTTMGIVVFCDKTEGARRSATPTMDATCSISLRRTEREVREGRKRDARCQNQDLYASATAAKLRHACRKSSRIRTALHVSWGRRKTRGLGETPRGLVSGLPDGQNAVASTDETEGFPQNCVSETELRGCRYVRMVTYPRFGWLNGQQKFEHCT